MPRQADFFSEHVGRAAGEQGHRDAVAIFLDGESVNDFIQRPVAATSDDELASFDSGSLSHYGGIAGRSRFLKVGLDAPKRQNAASFIEHAPAAFTAVAGVRVVNQESVAKTWQH